MGKAAGRGSAEPGAGELLRVARLGRTRGLGGMIKIHNLGDFAGQFRVGASFFSDLAQPGCLACEKGGQKRLVIKAFDEAAFTAIFEGFESVEAARGLVNSHLLQSIEATRRTCRLGPGEFFYFDVLGSELVVEPGQKTLGRVVGITQSAGPFLLECRVEPELVRRGLAGTFFIPYLDRFITKIDPEAKLILATPAAFELLESL